LLSRDEANDLALLQITPRTKLPSLHLGDSDGLQVGQKVLAIGNPFGLEGTLTTGIVSSLGRSIRGENERTLEGLIQTDAAINPGNSGGPLLDSAGNVVGINTAILGPNGGNIGIGFAMPINRAKLMLDDFQAGRKRPKLGVSVVPISGDYADALKLPTQGGLLIQEVDPDSPAARAGLRGGRQEVQIGNAQVLVGGDLIMSIDGKPVERDDAISRALAQQTHRRYAGADHLPQRPTMNVRVRWAKKAPSRLNSDALTIETHSENCWPPIPRPAIRTFLRQLIFARQRGVKNAGSSVWMVIGTPARYSSRTGCASSDCHRAGANIARDADFERDVVLAKLRHQNRILAAAMPCPMRSAPIASAPTRTPAPPSRRRDTPGAARHREHKRTRRETNAPALALRRRRSHTRWFLRRGGTRRTRPLPSLFRAELPDRIQIQKS
jgi:hypothetical protein